MTRQTDIAEADLDRIIAQAAWLKAHLPDMDVIANTPGWQPGERVQGGTKPGAIVSGPVLSEQGQHWHRQQVRDICKVIADTRLRLTRSRVILEALQGQLTSADTSLLGTMLDDGELDQARKAQQRRIANQGDPRWGEHEFTPTNQTGATAVQ